MTLATKSGGLILKNGKIATNCACCCPISSQACGYPSWTSCRGDAPTIQVFGATFTLTEFVVPTGLFATTPSGWVGQTSGCTGSGILWSTNEAGNQVALLQPNLYRVGSASSDGSSFNSFSAFASCSFKYHIAGITGFNTNNSAIEYPSNKVPSCNPLASLPGPIRRAQFLFLGIVLSPEFTTFGGNAWESEADLFLGFDSQAIGKEPFYFSDGNTVYPNQLP